MTKALPVLLYHHVGSVPPGTRSALTVSPRRFRAHIRWLARCGYVGIRPADWVAWRRDGAPLPRRPVLVTFDDAYADLVDHALPVLRAHGFGAAVFVVTGQIGGENVWDQAQGAPRRRVMSAAEIRAWSQEGIEFGAHSRTHRDLRTLDAAALADEVTGSRDDLAAIVGGAVRSFAYPFGALDDRVLQVVRETYDAAFSCEEGLNSRATELARLRRTMVQPADGAVAVLCRARLGRRPVDRWRVRLQLRTRAARAVAFVRGLAR